MPKAFTIDELERLHDAFNQDGRKIIESYVREIFLNAEKDALLVKVYRTGPKDDKKSCFFNEIEEI